MDIPVLTIDGPSGAGKGTISRAIAKSLGWHYLDSGSIYRSLAIAVVDTAVAVEDIPAIVTLAEQMDLAFDCGSELSVTLNGEDITRRLGLEETGRVASIIAAIPAVRAALLQKQKAFRQPPGLVADGRDMGTVVFPEAPYKVFLTASAKVRALRRYKQLKEKEIDANLEQITQDLEERDRRDQERSTAPLVSAKDALMIDSSDMSPDQVRSEVMNLIQNRSSR